ncbi:hypothetical protein [Brevundimonas naejangsanensis]
MGEITDMEALMRLRSFAAACREGRFIGRTWMVALRLEVTTTKARAIMNRLAKAGKVERSERYSAVNDIAWQFPEESRQ